MGLMCVSPPTKQRPSPFPSPAQLSSTHRPAQCLLTQPGPTLLASAPPSPAQLNSHLRTAQPGFSFPSLAQPFSPAHRPARNARSAELTDHGVGGGLVRHDGAGEGGDLRPCRPHAGAGILWTAERGGGGAGGSVCSLKRFVLVEGQGGSYAKESKPKRAHNEGSIRLLH